MTLSEMRPTGWRFEAWRGAVECRVGGSNGEVGGSFYIFLWGDLWPFV